MSDMVTITKEEYEKLKYSDSRLEYYGNLLDYLDDMVPCLSDLIEQFNQEEN